jgi:hypothetical protein
MFSRRVFELMACGTPVVSTYARGIEDMFESDAVWLVGSRTEADEALNTLMTDDDEWRRRSLAGIREVFSGHTYAHRLNEIFECLGLDKRISIDPKINLVAQAESQAEIETLVQSAQRQSYRNFEMAIACEPDLLRSTTTSSERLRLLEQEQLDSWLKNASSEGALAGQLSPFANYGEHYLRDLVNASVYQPDAIGWAKALDHDLFDFDGEADLDGTLWKAPEFPMEEVGNGASTRIRQSNLYIADSDQFQPAGQSTAKLEG